MDNMTNEMLVARIVSGSQAEIALAQLLHNLRPMIMLLGKKHLGSIPIYDADDYFQEGSLVLWKLVSQNRYNAQAGKFSNLFYTAFQRKCLSLYRSYVLKNYIQIAESEDFYHYGYQVSILTEDDYAKRYRETHRQQCRTWTEKQQAAKPPKPITPKLTPEERREQKRLRSRQYHEAHREECNRRKREWYQKNRDYARLYQKAYANGVRIGKKGPPPKIKSE